MALHPLGRDRCHRDDEYIYLSTVERRSLHRLGLDRAGCTRLYLHLLLGAEAQEQRAACEVLYRPPARRNLGCMWIYAWTRNPPHHDSRRVAQCERSDHQSDLYLRLIGLHPRHCLLPEWHYTRYHMAAEHCLCLVGRRRDHVPLAVCACARNV